MSDVVELPLGNGDVVYVEVDGDITGEPGRVGRTPRVLSEASETLQEALRRTRSAIETTLGQMRELAEPPDKVTIKFGVKVTASAGVVIAKAASEANFELAVEWVKPPVTATA